MVHTSLPHRAAQPGVDIFCRVIDNYGDIGVCWRLARQLASRKGTHQVRLWVDDLGSFARIEPKIQADVRLGQLVQGVDIYHWDQAEREDVLPLSLVIEAFACDLPTAFRSRLAPQTHSWVNLEYLSAEPWVEDCHGLPSAQADGIAKFFFFPGFTPRTGGLLRETGLIARRDEWLRTPDKHAALLHKLGLPPAWISGITQQGWRQCYAFCYPHAPLQALVDACESQGPAHPTVLLAAPGAPATRQSEGKVLRFDCPFVDQQDFDQLLWSSDLNCIRGEDSFVRAIWAARPFLWHIYPQQEEVHMDKLDAWLALSPCPPEAAKLMRDWNRTQAPVLGEAFGQLLTRPLWQEWQDQAARFSAQLAAQDDLVQQLLRLATPQP